MSYFYLLYHSLEIKLHLCSGFSLFIGNTIPHKIGVMYEFFFLTYSLAYISCYCKHMFDKFYRNLARKLHPTTVGCEMNCTGWLFASLFVFPSFNVLTFVFDSPLAFNVFLNFFHNFLHFSAFNRTYICLCYKYRV